MSQEETTNTQPVEEVTETTNQVEEPKETPTIDLTQINELISQFEKQDLKSLPPDQLAKLVQLKKFKTDFERYERHLKKSAMEETNKVHKFWNTQPVLAFNEKTDEHGPIDKPMTVDEVRKTPLKLPEAFEWSIIDVKDHAQATELYTLLNENYVEDDDAMFRFDYSVPFLQWSLSPPGQKNDWVIGVRNIKTGKLMASITAVPVTMKVHDSVMPMAEINFLCVHKKLRSYRLAPVLIKEITRRVNQYDIWQAVYTAGVVIPTPISRCRYFHRSLNPKKLIEIRFSSLPPKTTLASHIKSLKVDVPLAPALSPMTPKDVPGVTKILNEYLHSKTKLHQIFTEEEVAHIFLPRENVVNSYVLRSDKNEVTDFASFYHLPSSVMKNPLHNHLSAVYSFYNVANTISLHDLISYSLINAKAIGVDVFNALDLMDNAEVLTPLKFAPGDGYLQYYVYNWKCPTISSNEVGMVLL